MEWLQNDNHMGDVSKRAILSTRREQIRDLACRFQPQLATLFVIEVIMLALAVFSLIFIEPGTRSYVILLVDFFLLGIAMVPTIGILYMCSRRN